MRLSTDAETAGADKRPGIVLETNSVSYLKNDSQVHRASVDTS
jgi:hypothetical protein